MSIKIVIASDSFKGSLASSEVNAAIASGIRRVLSDAELLQIPVADGGEGTMSMLVDALGGEFFEAEVCDPLTRHVAARYGIVNDRGIRTAVIEMAQASGLPLLSAEERDPLAATTFGTGQLIIDAYNRGCRNFIIGIGGSATNDGGAGMLSALGARMLDSAGHELNPGGAELLKLHSIDLEGARKEILECPFTVICDVDNPLTGPNGASHVFGPQKGASPADVLTLDSALANYASKVAELTGRQVADQPGAGAAGGMGAAFLAFFNATLRPGIDTTLDTIGFSDLIRGASLVITGEGKIDSQTLRGKTPSGILRRGSRQGIPVVALGGAVEDAGELCRAGFAAVLSIQQSAIPLAEAMDPAKAARNLADTAEQIARLIFNLNPLCRQ